MALSYREQQEEVLEDISKSLSRLQETSVVINGELKSQNEELGKLDSEVDESNEELKRLDGKLARFLKSDASKMSRRVCVGVLLVIVIVVEVILIIE